VLDYSIREWQVITVQNILTSSFVLENRFYCESDFFVLLVLVRFVVVLVDYRNLQFLSRPPVSLMVQVQVG